MVNLRIVEANHINTKFGRNDEIHKTLNKSIQNQNKESNASSLEDITDFQEGESKFTKHRKRKHTLKESVMPVNKRECNQGNYQDVAKRNIRLQKIHRKLKEDEKNLDKQNIPAKAMGYEGSIIKERVDTDLVELSDEDDHGQVTDENDSETEQDSLFSDDTSILDQELQREVNSDESIDWALDQKCKSAFQEFVKENENLLMKLVGKSNRNNIEFQRSERIYASYCQTGLRAFEVDAAADIARIQDNVPEIHDMYDVANFIEFDILFRKRRPSKEDMLDSNSLFQPKGFEKTEINLRLVGNRGKTILYLVISEMIASYFMAKISISYKDANVRMYGGCLPTCHHINILKHVCIFATLFVRASNDVLEKSFELFSHSSNSCFFPSVVYVMLKITLLAFHLRHAIYHTVDRSMELVEK